MLLESSLHDSIVLLLNVMFPAIRWENEIEWILETMRLWMETRNHLKTKIEWTFRSIKIIISMTGCFQLENIHECQVYDGVRAIEYGLWTNQRNYDGNC